MGIDISLKDTFAQFNKFILFPSNFINILDRPANYMGASDFLSGYSSSSNPYIKKFYSENFNDKLLEALDAFILSGAIKLYREEMKRQQIEKLEREQQRKLKKLQKYDSDDEYNGNDFFDDQTEEVCDNPPDISEEYEDNIDL